VGRGVVLEVKEGGVEGRQAVGVGHGLIVAAGGARVNAKALLATHLDWLMLAFMQLGAAFIFSRWPVTAGGSVAWMLVFGGWVNPLPYLVRGFGIDAFVFAGPPVQRLAAAVAGASVAAIVAAWALILYRFPI